MSSGGLTHHAVVELLLKKKHVVRFFSSEQTREISHAEKLMHCAGYVLSLPEPEGTCGRKNIILPLDVAKWQDKTGLVLPDI